MIAKESDSDSRSQEFGPKRGATNPCRLEIEPRGIQLDQIHNVEIRIHKSQSWSKFGHLDQMLNRMELRSDPFTAPMAMASFIANSMFGHKP